MSRALFKDRVDAGRQLAAQLQEYRGQRPLILAIPRGGLPLGEELARLLEGDLDVVLVHKLCRPYDPEFALGAIDESGNVMLAPWAHASPDDHWLLEARREQLAALQARRARYAAFAPTQEIKGRVVIIVDDGLATGATMASALRSVRARQPKLLICAVPMGAPESVENLLPLADRIVCLHQPSPFGAVSQFYEHFGQVSDEEAEASLRQAANRSSK